MANTDTERILIAGGGIGGLALAVALAQAGRRSLVLEGRAEFSVAGAGIQIGPNGTRVLQQLGVAEALAPQAGVPEAIHVYHGSRGRRLARLPLGDWIARRHGAPYWVVHRADLHKVLLDAALRSDLIDIEMGFVATELAQQGDGVTVSSEAGKSVQGAGVVGADGLWSRIRRQIVPAAAPAFADASACRIVLPAERAGRLSENAVGLWLSPGAHVVHYPLRGGREIAVVVISEETWQSRVWDAEIDRVHLGRALACFTRELESLLLDAPGWRRWSLHRLPTLPQWHSGRAVLIGDAAHPMFPYLAQGGVLALEDAAELAACLGPRGVDVPGAFAQFAKRRRDRAERVQAASARNGTIYHMQAPLAVARDAAFTAAPGPLLMSTLDWLYGWKPSA
jgi:salicylate hydroxylase